MGRKLASQRGAQRKTAAGVRPSGGSNTGERLEGGARARASEFLSDERAEAGAGHRAGLTGHRAA